MKRITLVGIAGFVAAAAFVVFVPEWHLPIRHAVEMGYPQSIQFQGKPITTGFERVPPTLPTAPAGGPSATQQYKNVQVLTDVSAAEFMRLQHAITQWVAPTQGCAFCHVAGDYASDAKPTKQVARLMLTMTRHLNSTWSNHVSPSGVTCYTCHRGQPVPAEIWFPEPPPPVRSFVDKQENWDEAADTVRKFFPDDGFAEYYLQDEPISVQSTTALPSHTVAAQVVTKRIYEMMMEMSDGIGVNCGYCHNSRAFESWEQSTPYRWNAYDAIRLLRDLNRNFLTTVPTKLPLTRQMRNQTAMPVLPARDADVQVGNGLVLCATCHYGQTKPLNGAAMAPSYPGLAPASGATASAAAPGG